VQHDQNEINEILEHHEQQVRHDRSEINEILEHHEQYDEYDRSETREIHEQHDFYKHEKYEQFPFGMDWDGILQTSIYFIHDLI